MPLGEGIISRPQFAPPPLWPPDGTQDEQAKRPANFSTDDEAPDVKGFSPGDLVAAGGANIANHAEYVAVPVNLCVKLPGDAREKKDPPGADGDIGRSGQGRKG